MFGALYGDVIGSYYEVHCTKEYDFPLMRESTFTDDGVLTAAVCRTILDNPSNVSFFGMRRRAAEFAANYRAFFSRFPNAGFGNMFKKWARDPYAPRGRSYANGAAMRVAPIAYAYDDYGQMLRQVKTSCLPTHSHPEAIRAAKAVASAVWLARKGKSKDGIKAFIEKEFKYDLSRPLAEIRKTHVFDSRASYSVPPAIIAFLESSDYESAVRGAVSLGGDADTQACIAGAIAEAYYKEIPKKIRDFCDLKIDCSIRAAVREFEEKYSN